MNSNIQRAWVAAAAVLMSSAAWANSYTLVDLGDCDCRPTSINGSGTIVASRLNAPFRGQVDRGGEWRNFQPHSMLTAVNRKGDIAGYFKGGPNDGRAAIWLHDGTTLSIDPPTGGEAAQIADLDVSLDAIGTYVLAGQQRCFEAIQGREAYDMAISNCEARAISGTSLSAGNTTLANGNVHAWRYALYFYDLGVLPGADYSLAFGMDWRGDIVGTSGSNAGGAHAFWGLSNLMIDLDPRRQWYVSVATATSSNKSPYLVGYASSCDSCDTVAVRFDPEGQNVISLLTEVINPGTWTSLTTATSVNEKGEIVGVGDNGVNAAEPFLLVPQGAD